ncbi:MAG: EcsC family protein [Chitinophagales bacterium]|nr:EcsC family protein [Chitinophagales bacterium]
MTTYEKNAAEELQRWEKQMLRRSSTLNRAAKNLQNKINKIIPEKVHRAVTKAIKETVRVVLFGAKFTTRKLLKDYTLEARELLAQERIGFYKKTAAFEGGVTGAAGFLASLADFPILLTLKIKLLFDIAALYGYSVKDYRERLYILYIFQLAFSSREHSRAIFIKIKNWTNEANQLPADIHEFDWRSFQQEYRDYIDIAKLAQFIPFIGAAVGAIVNYNLVNKLGRTAINAYRLRYFDGLAFQTSIKN